MPKPLAVIPSNFQDRAFTTREAASTGLSRDVLHHPRFERLHHGVYQLAAPLEMAARDPASHGGTALQLARGYAPLLRPGEVFSHATALLLYGVPLHVAPEIHVTIPAPRSPAAGRGVMGHTLARSWEEWLPHEGIPCMPPAIALFQAANHLSFRELVVAIDFLILPRGMPWELQPLVDREALGEFVHSARGRGVQRLRAAFAVARVGAESRMESIMHFEQARIGIDVIPMQVTLHDEQGNWIGRFDQADVKRRKILEYDGEQHRTDRDQYLRDEEKLDAARRSGYDLLRLRKENFVRARLASTRARISAFFELPPRRISAELIRFFHED